METVSNPVKPKIRNRIQKVINRLYEQSGRYQTPSLEVVCRLTNAPAAACAEVLREWCAPLPSAPIEADAAGATEWMCKVTELAAKRKIANENFAAAAAACEAENAATDQFLTEIVTAFEVQAEELCATRARAVLLEKAASVATSAAVIARQECEEAKKQLETIAKETCRALSCNNRMEQLADELRDTMLAAQASAQALFAEIELNRNERSNLRARVGKRSSVRVSPAHIALTGTTGLGAASASTATQGDAVINPIRFGLGKANGTVVEQGFGYKHCNLDIGPASENENSGADNVPGLLPTARKRP
jgi:hypothetical protein